MFDASECDALRQRYEAIGLLPATFALANTAVMPALRRDVPMYREEILRNAEQRLFRVPYLLTQSIIDAAQDPAIVSVAAALLQTRELVMWGPNLQVGTPNQASAWHTDIESSMWPSVTVVVGLYGCDNGNATRCISASHTLPVSPRELADVHDSASVLRAAQRLSPACNEEQGFEGFGNGRFYAFNARCWHAGQETASVGRELLFLHYDRADRRRIPYMHNHQSGTWFDFPATYMKVPLNGDFHVNEQLYDVPIGSTVISSHAGDVSVCARGGNVDSELSDFAVSVDVVC